MMGTNMKKKYPATTDFLYVRNYISQCFKLQKRETLIIKYRHSNNEPYNVIEDLSKGFDYYGIKTGS
jgi:hypothetical protein